MARRDPRDIVTPYRFHVDPLLLGRPLASPWRRLAAIAVDLPLVGLLVLAGGVLFGVGLAYALWRMTRRRRGIFVRRGAVWAARGLAVGVLAVTAMCALGPSDPDDPDVPGEITSPGDVVGLLAEGALVLQADSPAETRRAARQVARQLVVEEEEPGQVTTLFESLGEEFELPDWKRAILREEAAAVTGGPLPRDPPDSLAEAWALAREAGDSERADALREELADAVAADTIAALQADIERLAAANDALESQMVEARQGFSLLRAFSNVREDNMVGRAGIEPATY